MRKFIIKRLFYSIIIFFFVMLIIYTLMRCLPTSYIESLARQRSMQPGSKSYEEWMAQLTAMYNMDKGILLGYLNWLKDFFRGNFGDSWYYTVPVVQKFHETIWLSFWMGLISMFFELVIAIPLGIVAATKQYSRTDHTVWVLALPGICLPPFVCASRRKLFFSVKMGWFDLFGLVGRNYEQLSSWGQFLDKANHLVLPILTLVVISIGSLMRYTRTNMLEVLNADYIRTARAKGLSEKVVINKHAFRNTLIPLVSYMSYLLPSMFGGAMITEELFQIPGIGRISYQAMTIGDIPFTMFYTLFLTVLTQVSLILADIMYAVVDPRVRVN